MYADDWSVHSPSRDRAWCVSSYGARWLISPAVDQTEVRTDLEVVHVLLPATETDPLRRGAVRALRLCKLLLDLEGLLGRLQWE